MVIAVILNCSRRRRIAAHRFYEHGAAEPAAGRAVQTPFASAFEEGASWKSSLQSAYGRGGLPGSTNICCTTFRFILENRK